MKKVFILFLAFLSATSNTYAWNGANSLRKLKQTTSQQDFEDALFKIYQDAGKNPAFLPYGNAFLNNAQNLWLNNGYTGNFPQYADYVRVQAAYANVQSAANQTDFKNALFRVYDKYGDPEDRPFGTLLIEDVEKLWDQQFRNATSFPDYTTYLNTPRGGSGTSGSGTGTGGQPQQSIPPTPSPVAPTQPVIPPTQPTPANPPSYYIPPAPPLPGTPGTQSPGTYVNPKAPKAPPLPSSGGQSGPGVPPPPPLFPSQPTKKPGTDFKKAQDDVKALVLPDPMPAEYMGLLTQLRTLKPEIFCNLLVAQLTIKDIKTIVSSNTTPDNNSTQLANILAKFNEQTLLKTIYVNEQNQLLSLLYRASTSGYLSLCDGPVPKLIAALESVFKKMSQDEQRKAPIKDLTTFQSDMLSFAIDPRSEQDTATAIIPANPADYIIKDISDYDAVITMIPQGTLQDSFRKVLEYTLATAKAMKETVTILQTKSTFDAQTTLPTSQSITDVRTAFIAIETDLQQYNTSTIAPGLTANTITQQQAKDMILKKADALVTQSKTFSNKLQAAQTAIKQLKTAQKTTFSPIQSKLRAIAQSLNYTLAAQKGGFSAKNIASVKDTLKNAVTDLVAALNAYNAGASVSQQPATPTISSDETSNFTIIRPLEQQDFIQVGNASPFVVSLASLTGSAPNADTIDQAIKVEAGILKQGYDVVDQSAELTKALGNEFAFLASSKSKQPIINPDGGYDLYIWGPAVKDYTQDVYLLGRLTPGDKQLTVRFSNIQGDLSTKTTLYKLKSYTKAETQTLKTGPSVSMPSQGAFPRIADYLYQKLLLKLNPPLNLKKP